MRIKWQGDSWSVKYYPDSYARWTLENGNTSVSWLVNEENNFRTQEEFIKFLREREKKMEGTIKYSQEEVEEIVLAYHVIIMPSPKKGMKWVVTERTYGGAECALVEDKKEKKT